MTVFRRRTYATPPTRRGYPNIYTIVYGSKLAGLWVDAYLRLPELIALQ